MLWERAGKDGLARDGLLTGHWLTIDRLARDRPTNEVMARDGLTRARLTRERLVYGLCEARKSRLSGHLTRQGVYKHALGRRQGRSRRRRCRRGAGSRQRSAV